MSDVQIAPDQMEVFTATAEIGEIDNLPGILELPGDNRLASSVRRAQLVVDLRNTVICEGVVSEPCISIGDVTKGLISLDFDQERIRTYKEDSVQLVERCIASGRDFSIPLDRTLTPQLLLFNALIPDRHRVIEITQLSAEAPELVGLDSRHRMQELVLRHFQLQGKEQG